jgi:ketosteroid isomerase-like protein
MTGTQAAHPNARLLRELFAAFDDGDIERIGASFTEDVHWTTPGRSQLAGEFVGRKAVLAQLARSSELSGSTYRVTVEDVLASDARASVLYRGTGSRRGCSFDLRHLALYDIASGMISAVRIAPLDQYAFDDFWS